MNPAPIVDHVLAAELSHVRDPIERLAPDQGLALTLRVMNDMPVRADGARLVQLACTHFTVARALRRAACPRCGAMIRAGYDYDAFRRLGEPERFVWPDDPLRGIHESA